MSKIITQKNQHGEDIHVKLENGIVLVHHTDCTSDYISLNELVADYILSLDELAAIYNSVKAIQHAGTPENILNLFKI
jgi:hypothetical protein